MPETTTALVYRTLIDLIKMDMRSRNWPVRFARRHLFESVPFCPYRWITRNPEGQTQYHSALASGPRSIFSKPLSAVRLIEIARKNPPTVRPTDKFGTVAKVLIRHPSQTIFITGENESYRGAIVSSDILQFAQTKELAEAIIAIDVSRNNLPVLLPEMKLPDALKIFAARKHEDSLALVENEETRKLLGVVNRSDLYLALGEIMRREKVR